MAYSVDQGALLDRIRTAIGASTTVGVTVYTWKHKLEGPALRWLKLVTDYPLITLEIGDTAVEPGAALDQVTVGVTVYAVIKPSTAPPARVYQVVRELGEQLLSDIMSAPARIANWRHPLTWGIDYDAMDAEDVYDQGFGVYKIDLACGCVVEDRNP
ncbi:MAG TPA: hypothetical protein VFH61_16860 [Thermoleophilia bacterium]|nr:hypothetical protein [Thermoleophilia bacterium]